METITSSTGLSKPLSISGSKSDVLLIDNDLASYYLIYELLSDYHVNVIHARCGFEGVFLFKNKEVALVISEIKLPKLDGFEVLRQIRKENPEIPVWTQTAVVLHSIKERCLSAGFNEFIEKPLDFKKFNNCVKKYLRIPEPTLM